MVGIQVRLGFTTQRGCAQVITDMIRYTRVNRAKTMRERMTEIQCMHMQGDNKLALLNRANILGASNIFSTHLAQSIGANNKKKRTQG